MSAPARAALALLALLCAASLAPAGAAARTLEVPVFLAPGRNPDQSPSTAPGARPFEVLNDFALNQSPTLGGVIGPAENIRDLRFELPAGLLAAAARYPRCSAEAFAQSSCATVAQVGVAELEFSAGAPSAMAPVFNLAPPSGRAAQFAFRAAGAPVYVDFALRNGGDYGATATVRGLSEAAGLLRSTLRIWGVPGDPAHDAERFTGAGVPVPGPYPEAPPFQPLISNPTSCRGPLVTTMQASTWQHPERLISAAPFEAPGTNSCDQLEFDPTIEAKPTTNLADSPSGLDVHLHIRQIQDPEGRASAGLRDVRIDLPAGLTVNPAGANGLATCSPAQIGLAGVASERQLLRYDMPPVSFSGTFTVSRGGATTAPISSTATAAQVRSALETLPGLAGNVAGRAAPRAAGSSPSPAPWRAPTCRCSSGQVTDNPSQVIAVTATGGTFKLEPRRRHDLGPALQRHRRRNPGGAPPDPGARPRQHLPRQRLRQRPRRPKKTPAPIRVIFANDLNGAKPALVASSSLTGPAAEVDDHPDRPAAPARRSASPPSAPAPPARPSSAPRPSPAPTPPRSAPCGSTRPPSSTTRSSAASTSRPPDRTPTAPCSRSTSPSPTRPRASTSSCPPGSTPTRPRAACGSASPRRPQLPFEDLDLELFKGTAAPLRTPSVCATYTVEALLTPSSAPEGASRRKKADAFTIANGAGAGACPQDRAAVPDPDALHRRHRRSQRRHLLALRLEARAPRRQPASSAASTPPCPRACWPRLAGSPALLRWRSRRRRQPTPAAAEHRQPELPGGLADRRRSTSLPAPARPPTTSAAVPTWPAPTAERRSAWRWSPRRWPGPSTSAPSSCGSPSTSTPRRPGSGPSPTRFPATPARPAARPALGRPQPRPRLRQEPDLLLPARVQRSPERPLPGRRLPQARLRAEARACPQGRDRSAAPTRPSAPP